MSGSTGAMPADEIEIAAHGYALRLAPDIGGSVTRFDWHGQPLFRAAVGAGPLEQACFPLVPFSNRIAHGRFAFRDEAVTLSPNFPGTDHPHPLHGFGWQAPWHVVEKSDAACVLRHDHHAGEWPWDYRAEQRFTLSSEGLIHELRVRNCAARPMPVGLGFHPYFPRTPHTLLLGLHRGEWQTDAEGLPQRLVRHPAPLDWWHGRPVATRSVDTVYDDRAGPLTITWPERALTLTIDPDPALRHTVIYCPRDADYFCVEPVTHSTDAFNRPDAVDELVVLAPGAWHGVSVTYRASPAAAD